MKHKLCGFFFKFDLNTSLLRDASCSKIVVDGNNSNKGQDCLLRHLLAFSGKFAKIAKNDS